MSASVTLLALRDRIRFEADMVNSTRATDAQITRLVNTHWAELYDRLVSCGPPDYYASTSTVTTVAGTIAYALPADFRSLIGLFINNSSTRRRELRPLPEGLRAGYDAPSGVVSLTLEYVPAPVTLALDADTVDGVSGWDELVVQLCARALLRRERRDVSAFDRAIEEARARVMANAPKRAMDGPRFVNDVEAGEDWRTRDADAEVHAYRLSAGSLMLYTVASVWP
jgi:hypothetical protein